ncbi:hypothetical protein DPEC_G00172370 [Dallia pectoralis]|uniref:Uncharacterized protein n=1 Tax=Dallia pectoralis TaxID=75939 RepID=A0ACC2GDI2_DALPE|nr:hypothetical protein DPEC_G00172370 [Dallia pectoralis]
MVLTWEARLGWYDDDGTVHLGVDSAALWVRSCISSKEFNSNGASLMHSHIRLNSHPVVEPMKSCKHLSLWRFTCGRQLTGSRP